MSDGGNAQWARSLRAQLVSDIQMVGARAREGSARSEELGQLPYRDRLAELQRRLAQVERLIDALEVAESQEDDDWSAGDGDPAHPSQSRRRH